MTSGYCQLWTWRFWFAERKIVESLTFDFSQKLVKNLMKSKGEDDQRFSHQEFFKTAINQLEKLANQFIWKPSRWQMTIQILMKFWWNSQLTNCNCDYISQTFKKIDAPGGRKKIKVIVSFRDRHRFPFVWNFIEKFSSEIVESSWNTFSLSVKSGTSW
jgi:hypothetical protein